MLSRFYTALGFGSSHVYCFPLERAEEFRKRFEVGGYTLYAVAIPPSRTTRELGQMFELEMQALIPPDAPSPTAHPGRRGRCQSGSPLAMLNQLAAFRLERKGFTFSKAREQLVEDCPYVSQKGWKKGVSAARARIENMVSASFF